MAESQAPFHYEDADIVDIRSSLSEERFATFLTEARGNERFAIELYLYNARLAKSFLYPLHIAEVTLRNAVDRVLVDLHGADWPGDGAFRAILNSESLTSLDKAITRARRIALNPPRGQIVATLTFDFWSNLFRPEYDRPLWQVNLTKALPHCPKGATRADVQPLAKDTNHLRNRIAHHEPILHVNVRERHAKLVELTGFGSPTMARWLRHFSTVETVTRTRPRPNGPAQTVMSRCDPGFQVVGTDQKLSVVLAAHTPTTPAIVVVDEAGAPLDLLTAADLWAFVAIKAPAGGGLVDFGEHDIAAVLASGAPKGRCVMLEAGAPLAMLPDTLKQAGIRGVVAFERVEGIERPRGVVLRAHRRY